MCQFRIGSEPGRGRDTTRRARPERGDPGERGEQREIVDDSLAAAVYEVVARDGDLYLSVPVEFLLDSESNSTDREVVG